MSRIDTQIVPQNYELIRDQIGAILKSELENQYNTYGEEELNAGVFVERTDPVPHAEAPMVIVSIIRFESPNQEKSAENSDNTVRYAIDCYHKSKSEGTDRGDSLSRIKLHRLMGVCRAIIEDPRYKFLQNPDDNGNPFKGVIGNRSIESLEIAEVGKQDTTNTSMGRLVLSVRMRENTDLIIPNLLEGSDTQLKFELTDEGYLFTIDA